MEIMIAGQLKKVPERIVCPKCGGVADLQISTLKEYVCYRNCHYAVPIENVLSKKTKEEQE